MLTIFAALLSPLAALAGGGVSIEVVDSIRIATCNSGQVSFTRNLIEYDEIDSDYENEIVVRTEDAEYIFRAVGENALFNQKGSQLKKLIDVQIGKESGWEKETVTLETKVKFNGTPGFIRANLKDSSSPLSQGIELQNCYRE